MDEKKKASSFTLLSNFHNKEKERVLEELKEAGVVHIILTEARKPSGECYPDHFGVFVPNDDSQNDKIDRFFNLSLKYMTEYGEKLHALGITEEEIGILPIYEGCEYDHFPEKCPRI